MAGKHKYCIVNSETAGGFVEALNECGQDGFRVIHVGESTEPFWAILEREISDQKRLVPGDHVRVVGNPYKQHLRGKTGVVKSTWSDAIVEIDGEDEHLTFNSLELDEPDNL